jgi:hypothetical protein
LEQQASKSLFKNSFLSVGRAARFYNSCPQQQNAGKKIFDCNDIGNFECASLGGFARRS